MLFFDLETQKGSDEVGGWHNIRLLRMSVGITCEERDDSFKVYQEPEVDSLVQSLFATDCVVGFNLFRFDYTVLSYYTRQDFSRINTIDMLDYIFRRYGFRVSLGNIAQATLQMGKSGDGLEAIRWFKNGEMDKIIHYCKQDVRITRDIYLFGKKNGYIFIPSKFGPPRKLAVSW